MPVIMAALKLLHYGSPIAIILYYISAGTVASCLLQKPTKHSKASFRKHSAAALLTLVVALYIAQGIGYLFQSAGGASSPPSQDSLVYIIISTFVFISLVLGLVEKKKILWHPYIGAWLTGLATEMACTALQALTEPPQSDAVASSRLALHVARVLILLILCIAGLYYGLTDRSKDAVHHDETEPLLVNGSVNPDTSNGRVVETQRNYGSATNDNDDDKDNEADSDEDEIDSDEDEPASAKEVKARQRKRLQESGNWLRYLKDFKIFIPILWPSKNRYLQGCLGVVGFVILSERFLNVAVPTQLGNITDKLAEGAGQGIVPWRAVGLWMLLSWLKSSAGLTLVKSLAELPVQQFALKSIGSTAFQHIMGLSMDFHNDKNSGELIRAIEQGQNLQGLLEFAFFEVGPMFIDLIVAFVYVYMLFDVYMSLILVAVGVIYVWIGAKTTVWSVKQRRRLNTAWRTESKVQNEAINNWQTVSHVNRGEYECKRYGASLDEYNSAEWYYYLAFYMGGSAQSAVMLLGRLAATSLAVYRVSQGKAPVGHFVTLTAYWSSIESPLAQISWSIRRVSSMLTDSERLLQLMTTKASVIDSPDAIDIDIKAGEVEFDCVNFAYDVRRPTLKDVSFVAKPGQTIALVGETGAGKSTILKLLYRYFDVTGGSIRIDGQDIRKATLDSLRDSFGMVPQDPALFNETLMANIKYARLDATDEEVMDACRAAAIHDKIESFPDKYNSTVGERGVKLSGGELQRVSIARAILRQPKIVLLDEATSMIDAETEALIQKAFRKLTHGRTTFIIAHRLSTIQHADLILVIMDGQIVERGTHQELFRQNGKYVKLWSKQLNKDVNEIGATLDVIGKSDAGSDDTS
ncbi:Hypothetical protein R9X50_00500100 [Acrodontium crateriforme]|uniref:AAA+ ATPase domain-containing protein n=1 Tax=Acrodontium crateriforme TaxID=150365 RepID=A0AAQ3RAK7_9PEZI|nr:Hypothetical protein R9X50_00500100 [Acrodontium crateriforme]